jgi:putative colanic acid biosynthesis UDP-glucose lipid carrier transferase
MFITLALLFDMISVSAAALTMWLLLLPVQADPIQYLLLVFATSILFPLSLSLSGGYRSFRAVSDFDWLTRVTVAWLLVALTVILGLWAVKLSEDFSRMWLGSWFLLGWLTTLSWRSVAYLLLMWLRAKGYNHKRVVIVGAGQLGQALIQQVQTNTGAGFEVIALFDDDALKWQTTLAGVSVFPAYELSDWLVTNDVHEVWFALPLRAESRLHELLHALRYSTVNLRYVPNLSSLRLLNHAPREILGFSMLDLSVSPMSEPAQRWLKAVEDKVLATIILLLISPLMLIIAIAIKLSSAGDVFFRQQRLGIDGKAFEVLKFRSMVVHAESDGKVTQASAQDLRITPLGKFLRRTSLDELPQFINVLMGDMSIVGPRPHAIAHNDYYKEHVDSYMRRHKVKPGITGWAQVHGWRGETDTLEKMEKRVEYDLWYIEHWSLALDLKIILLTLVHGFFHANAR